MKNMPIEMPGEVMLNYIRKIPEQIKNALENQKNFLVLHDTQRIVFSGMGGSGIVGDVFSDIFLGTNKQIYSFHDYSIPSWFDEKTLIFIISYSGNTQETISAYNTALKQKAKIVILCSGGNLLEIAKRDNVPVIMLPKGIPPRASFPYMFFSILTLLKKMGLIKGMDEDIKKTISVLSDNRIEKNAEILVDKIIGKIPLIYCSNTIKSVGYRWKTQFNENAKIFAFTNYFPELNHNELEPFALNNPYFHTIILSDEEDEIRIKKTIETSKKYISKGNSVTQIMLKGKSRLAKIFYAIALGDFASTIYALKNNINPLPVNYIEEFKKELRKSK